MSCHDKYVWPISINVKTTQLSSESTPCRNDNLYSNQKNSKLNAPNFVEHGEHGFASQKTGIKTNLNKLLLYIYHYQLYVCTCQCAHLLEFDIKSIWFDTTTFWVLHHSTQLMASSSSSSDPQHIVAILARIICLCRAKIFVLPKTNSSPPEIRPSQKETSSDVFVLGRVNPTTSYLQIS